VSFGGVLVCATLGAVRAKTASLLPTAATNRTFVSCQRLAKA
jgi:hypothetical protein